MKRVLTSLFCVLILFSCKHEPKDQNRVEEPDIRPSDTCKVSVLSQVNGNLSLGQKVTIYEAGTTNVVFSSVAKKGYVYAKLEVGQYYDFAVEGNADLASSLVKNLKIKKLNDDINIVSIAKIQKSRKEAFLDLMEFKLVKGTKTINIENGESLSTPIKGNFIAKVASTSSALYSSIAYGFTARLSIGQAPTAEGSLLNKNSIQGSLKSYPTYQNDAWVSSIEFSCGTGVWESFSEEEQDLIAVFYDATGNRLEVHNYLTLKPSLSNFQKYEGDQYVLQDFHVRAKTYKAENQIYSFSNKSPKKPRGNVGSNTSYMPKIYFSVTEKDKAPHEMPEILGVEIFRREKGDSEFEQVFATLYRTKNDIRESGSYLGGIVLDSSAGLEVGKEYDYKGKIYLASGYYLESSIVTCKILPEFRVFLDSPSDNASFTIDSTHTSFDKVLKEFKVRLNDGKLWNKDESDYFTMGLEIRQFNNSEMYRMLLRYHFDYMQKGMPEIEFATKQNGTTIIETLTSLKEKKMMPYYVGVDDIIEFNPSNSILTIKKDLFEARFLNMSKRWDTFKDGEIYYWDVFGAEEDFLKAVEADPRGRVASPPSFTKEYKSDDGKISYSRSYGASLLLSSTTSENGRFAFTIKGGAAGSVTSFSMPTKVNVIPGSYIVKAAPSFEENLESLGAYLYAKMSMEEGRFWYCIKTDSKEDILPQILKIKGVICADYEHEVKVPHYFETNEESSSNDGIKSLDLDDDVLEGSGYSLAITEALKAYEEFGFGDQKVLLGIVDSGVSLGHEDLKDKNGKSIIKDFFVQDIVDAGGGGKTFKGWKSSTNEWGDAVGHGTHCVGIMAATGENGKGIAGVCWKDAEVVMYRGLGDPTTPHFQEFASLDAIRAFTNYVKDLRERGKLDQACVPLNLSFGSPSPSPLAFEVISNALEAGVLPVVAMANDGLVFPSYPAAYSGVLAVGSSNGADGLSSYSNKGEWISCVAPGENIMSLSAATNDTYVCFNGTSMAAPFVTGMAAYLASLNPALTPYEIKAIIEKTADKILGSEAFNISRGYGRVNVYKAAKMAKEGSGGNVETPYSKFAVKVKVEGVLRSEDGGASFEFKDYVPYVFLYDNRGVCVRGGYLIADDPLVQNKVNAGIAIFRGLKKGKYTAKIHSYVYSEWPKVYRLIDSKELDFGGDEDKLIEFSGYTAVVK